ncbi:MAG: alpha/beta hydrolase [Conexibacter sp.]|nr:alpha/beta hydrolase [Conexibacter sp.]
MTLFQQRAGSGTPVVLLHGLTATHRYVVMGSKSLERAGHDVLAYDARGHGASDPAPEGPQAYEYADLAADLVRVLDDAGIERAVLAGASMGAHTAVRVALEHPERVAGLVVLTPAYDPEHWPGDLERWDALSDGLRTGGVEGFVEAYGDEGPERWRDTIQKVLRQRIAAHEHPEAVADALRVVPRSRPFEAREQLREIAAPTVVVADRDEADPGHPLAVGELYASLIPGARLVVEDEGQSPLAWQGGQVSRVIAELAAQAQQQA